MCIADGLHFNDIVFYAGFYEQQATSDVISTSSFGKSSVDYSLKLHPQYFNPAKCESTHSDSGIGKSEIQSQLDEVCALLMDSSIRPYAHNLYVQVHSSCSCF